VVTLLYFTQFYPEASPHAIFPTPNQDYYGWTNDVTEIEEMTLNFDILKSELNEGKTTRFGTLSRQVTINDDLKVRIEALINQIDPYDIVSSSHMEIIKEYEKYEEVMDAVDSELGGNTRYGSLYRTGGRELTYDEAKEKFNKLGKEDHYTRASARLFGDYMSISASIFPVFLVLVSFSLQRKETDSNEVHMAKLSSIEYIVSKYVSIVIMCSLLYVIYASHATIEYINFAIKGSYSIDYFAFYKVVFVWIVPSILYSVSLSTVILILTSKPLLSVIIPVAQSYLSMKNLAGDYGLTRNLIRYNILGDASLFESYSKAIMLNRFLYCIMAVLLLSVAIGLFQRKRANISAT
tara:strand:- start:88 stop:1140 length:1053 start_codon:yes stop_codon:yes gene_type:complete